MAATDISDQDLVSFLDDVHSNIENDDRTDFKKLTLYLFGFAHKLIAKIANGNGKLQLLQRTFDTIELVLSKKKYLLNTHISPPESELAIEIPGLLSLFYEWGLRFGIHHLFNYSTNHDETSHQTINCIKLFIITIINLVTTQLHGFQYKRKLQIILISTIEHDLAGLFSSLTTPYDKDNYQSQLVRCTHLFLIINDKDILIRLLANIAGMPLKLETFARKLWFVLCNYNDNIKVVDELKSVLISNLTNNIVVEETAGWADIALVVSWLTEFRDQFHESSSLPPIEYTTFIRSWCCCLFKVFLICIDRQLEHCSLTPSP